jgi:uncharacterized protein (DUF433 family)
MTNDHIVVAPAVLAGKPVVRGTRLSVELVIGLMADGWNAADIIANYPGLSREDIAALLKLRTRPVTFREGVPSGVTCAFSQTRIFRARR